MGTLVGSLFSSVRETGGGIATRLSRSAGVIARGGLAGRAVSLAGVLLLVVCLSPAAALATTPDTDINSTGPLTDIFLGNDLSCQAAYSGDTQYEFYPSSATPADCGTFIFTAGTLYAPDFANHAGTATGSLGAYTPWTPVSQSAVAGSGTTSSPYTVTTVASAGTTGLTLTDVDSYVVGQNTYRTDVTIANSTSSSQSGILYRAGDCFLQGSDSGYGAITGGNSPACTVNPNNSPAGRIESWVPITGGNSYVEDYYNTVWGDIGGHTDLPDTCQCSSLLDNGGGIAWDFTAPANGSVTYSHLTAFSPTGNLPLTTSKTADTSSVAAQGQDGYTITINNPNVGAVSLSSFTEALPAGFSYVAGSTTGATTSDPSASGNNLTWTGTFNVPGSGSTSLHFNVTAPASAGGPFYDNAGGTASGGFTVTPTGPTAPVTVTAGTLAALTTAKTADSSTVTAGGQDGYTIQISNSNSSSAALTSIAETLASGFSYVPGSTTGVTSANPSISGQTLTWSGSFSVPASGSVSLHFNVTAPATPGGPFFDNAGGTATGVSVTPTGPTAPVTVTGGPRTTLVHCKANQSCRTSLSTAVSDLSVVAGPGAAGTLSESVDLEGALECPGYTAQDPNWFGFFATATNRTKLLMYTLKNALLDQSQFCFGAPYAFTNKAGHRAVSRRLPNGSTEFVGLLPLCRVTHRGPCVSSRQRVPDSTSSTGYDVVMRVQIPAGLKGDPRGRI